MIGALALGVLALSAMESDDLNGAFRRAWYMNDMDFFWDQIPPEQRSGVFQKIFNGLSKQGPVSAATVKKLLGGVSDKFDEWTKYVYSRQLHEFVHTYLTDGLSLSHDDENEDFSRKYSFSDISISARVKALEDCSRFIEENASLIEKAYEFGAKDSQIAYDFWLTRNGHGSGFWCRGGYEYPQEVAEALSDAAKAFGEYYLYIGDDGQIYGEGG
jgi:hypothetical protein